jgi:ankyrin repeat protein
MTFRPSRPVFAAALLALALPVAAQQFSESYNFLKAVREQDGNKVTEFLNQPGQTIVNAKDDKGEGAIHIVTKRRDRTYLTFVLARGGNPNLQDSAGNTALMMAVEASWPEGVALLLSKRANINQGNNGGETPLIRAVQRRDGDLVRTLLDAKADPDQRDRLTGMNARDYAARDTRSPVIAQMLKDAPALQKRAVSGPSF